MVAGCGLVLAAADHEVPLLPAASDTAREGFIRIINHADRAGEVELTAVDDDGNGAGPLVLDINANETVELTAADVENGNPMRGLDTGAGSGSGDWRLELSSDLDIEVLAYVRSGDGLVSSMHEVVAAEDGRHGVAFFNRADAADRAGKLRVINPGEETATVTIRGVDDRGETPGTAVEVSIDPGGARTLTAGQLESGDDTLTGALGEGTGNWRLTVSADQPITVVNLLEGSAGLLANLSSKAPGADDAGRYRVPLFPGSSHPSRQGFVRVINLSDVAGTVRIEAFDASARDYEPITLALDANQAVQFDTDDLENGNAEIGLSGGTGAGEGDWWLALSSDLDIEVLPYSLAQQDGFLTPMHEAVPAVGHRHRVAMFNPVSELAPESQLRLANRGSDPARVSITGVDDQGASPGSGIGLTVAPGQVRTLTAAELEPGTDLVGELGDGVGKWRLTVDADAPILVMNLVTSPGGHLANLSSVSPATAPANASAFDDRVVGKRIVQTDATRFVDFLPDGGYSETRDGATTTGRYTYAKTGTSTASLSFTVDGGGSHSDTTSIENVENVVSCKSEVAFESRFSGRLRWCGDAEADSGWRLLEPSRQDGDQVTFEVTAVISTLAAVPEVVRGATVSADDGVRIEFENGGYVESGAHRFTCRDHAGCVIEDQVVIQGRVVRTVALGAADFNFVEDNRSPTGLAYGGGHFYVVDARDLKVYAYEASGERAPEQDFELAADNKMPAGITVGPEGFYVVDEGYFFDWGVPREVFVYDAAGKHLPDATIELDPSIREPLGIAYFDDRLFLAGAWTRKIYAYRTSGEREAEADFDLDPRNLSPRGIAYHDGRFFVVDIYDDKAYAYRTNGDRDRDADFNLADPNSLVRGIAVVNGRFFVADVDRVYAYPSDRPDLIVESFSVEDPRPDAGGTFTMNVRVRNTGYRLAASTTLLYVRSNDSTIHFRDQVVGRHAVDRLGVGEDFMDSLELTASLRAGFDYYGVCIEGVADESLLRNCSGAVEVTVPVDIYGPTVGFALDAENRNPWDLAYHGSRFFVLDSRDDHVYAYRTSAARDADSDFPLHADNDRPVAITYADGRFYVIDAGDDKVYAYDAAGERDADADFALDPDNGSAADIAFVDGRFYVPDRRHDQVYVYAASGEREAGADFGLFRGNSLPWSIAFAQDRLYVIDLIDRYVYAYTTSGERDTAAEFALYADNSSPQGITLANGRLYVADSNDDTIYGYAIPDVPDLTIDTAAVSDGSPVAGGSFVFTATVRNLGDEPSGGAGLRYYLASDSTYETADSLVGTASVGPLDPDAAVAVSVDMTAPTDPGCYFCGACVDVVHGERVRSNNCAVPAEILLGDGPDMDVSRLQMHTDGVGNPVQVTIGVINRGDGTSLPGKLRLTGGDDVVVDIPALAPNEEKIFERQRLGTGRSGTTTYEMCIDVPCEGDPEDNCRTRRVSL